MKKIMFSDRFGLTSLVLSNVKTQTRRTISVPRKFKGIKVSGFKVCTNARGEQYTYLVDADENEIEGSQLVPTWKVGETVAIAQRYGDVINMINALDIPRRGEDKGWENKMYVKAELMPHQIKITKVWIERLQKISCQDIRKEGIRMFDDLIGMYQSNNVFGYMDDRSLILHPTEQDAYADLIDNVSGKGTWNSNPLVWCYEFDLVK